MVSNIEYTVEPCIQYLILFFRGCTAFIYEISKKNYNIRLHMVEGIAKGFAQVP